MSSTPYQRGRQFEYRVKKRLEELGYLVMRAYASKGPFDLIAVGHKVVMLVQCKVGGACAPAEWNKLWDTAEMCSGVPVLATREKRKLYFYQMLEPKTGQRRQPMVLFAPQMNEPDEAYRLRWKKRPSTASAQAL